MKKCPKKEFMDYLEKIANKKIQVSQTLIEALKMMDSQKGKVLYVYEGSTFISLLTIGDIQRAIIAHMDMTTPIHFILNADKIYARDSDSMEQIRELMFQLRAESMPVKNDKGKLVNIYFWEDIFGNEVSETREKLDLPVVIMAGGKGTRLKPLTNIIPKPLIPIGDKTILETILDQFELIGSEKFYISVNYKYDILKYYLDNLAHPYKIEFFKEEKPLGTIGSVAFLKGKITTSFFVSNCDIIIDQDYRDVYEYHMSNKNDITIVTAVKNFKIPYGVIETGNNGLMVDLKEKPNLTYMINTGVYILNSELIEEIPENKFYHITDLIKKIKNRGGRVGCFPVCENAWMDMGDWNEYLKLIL